MLLKIYNHITTLQSSELCKTKPFWKQIIWYSPWELVVAQENSSQDIQNFWCSWTETEMLLFFAADSQNYWNSLSLSLPKIWEDIWNDKKPDWKEIGSNQIWPDMFTRLGTNWLHRKSPRQIHRIPEYICRWSQENHLSNIDVKRYICFVGHWLLMGLPM